MLRSVLSSAEDKELLAVLCHPRPGISITFQNRIILRPNLHRGSRGADPRPTRPSHNRPFLCLGLNNQEPPLTLQEHMHDLCGYEAPEVLWRGDAPWVENVMVVVVAGGYKPEFNEAGDVADCGVADLHFCGGWESGEA